LSKDWEVAKVFELAGKFTILAAVLVWFWESDQRELARQEATKSKHYRAWQIINLAKDSAGDAGRRDAIIDLNRDRVSLSGAPLANISLDDLNLSQADLNKSILQNSSFERACLKEARLSKTNLNGASFAYASLENADLTGSTLVGADLTSSILDSAILNRANLSGSNLSRASLRGAILHGVSLSGANLKEADLSGAEIDDVSMLQGTELCRTKMPDGSIDSSSCPDEASEMMQEKGDSGYSCKSSELLSRGVLDWLGWRFGL
jgi:uncharacterized protein YjbI with pentapeptide repeats